MSENRKNYVLGIDTGGVINNKITKRALIVIEFTNHRSLDRRYQNKIAQNFPIVNSVTKENIEGEDE